LSFEAFGLFSDPANNSPNATFQLKLGSTVLVSVAKPATTANWHLRAAITLRTVGPAAVAIGSLALTRTTLASTRSFLPHKPPPWTPPPR